MGQKNPHRQDDLSATYRDALKRHKPLTDVELNTLIQKAHNGDQKAFNTIVKANLRFVVNIAAQYRNASMSLDELVAEGNLGLIRAVEKFNPNLGYKFTTYAVWWIRQAIQKNLWKHKQLVRLPSNHFEDRDHIRRTEDRLRQTLGYDPSTEELAQHLNMTKRRIQLALNTQQTLFPLDASEPDDYNRHTPIADKTPDPQQTLENHESIHHVRAALKNLPAREAEILSLTFGLENDAQSLSKVGQKLGISKERVRQLRNRALNQMRHHLQRFAPLFQDTSLPPLKRTPRTRFETSDQTRRVA